MGTCCATVDHSRRLRPGKALQIRLRRITLNIFETIILVTIISTWWHQSKVEQAVARQKSLKIHFLCSICAASMQVCVSGRVFRDGYYQATVLRSLLLQPPSFIPSFIFLTQSPPFLLFHINHIIKNPCHSTRRHKNVQNSETCNTPNWTQSTCPQREGWRDKA